MMQGLEKYSRGGGRRAASAGFALSLLALAVNAALAAEPTYAKSGSKNHVIQREMYGKTILVGLSGKFE